MLVVIMVKDGDIIIFDVGIIIGYIVIVLKDWFKLIVIINDINVVFIMCFFLFKVIVIGGVIYLEIFIFNGMIISGIL